MFILLYLSSFNDIYVTYGHIFVVFLLITSVIPLNQLLPGILFTGELEYTV